jgi:hypothetical protein
MLKEIKKLLEEKDKAYKEFREKYDKVRDRFNNRLLELLPYKGKIIKVTDFYGCPVYIKVRELFKHSGDKIIIRGYGFSSEFTEYADATWANWSFMKTHEFQIDDIEKEVKNITIIDEVEFSNAFNDMIEKMKQEHLNELL